MSAIKHKKRIMVTIKPFKLRLTHRAFFKRVITHFFKVVSLFKAAKAVFLRESS